MTQNVLKAGLLSGAAGIAILVAYPHAAQAQMYATGPGVYVSIEGRYLFDRSDKSADLFDSFTVANFLGVTVTPPQTFNQIKERPDNGWGGKAMLGYRFNNGWDIGVGGSGGWLSSGKSSNHYDIDATVSGGIAGDPRDVTGTIDQTLKVKLTYEVGDFEVGYNWASLGSNLRLFGGVRFANFNQQAKSHIVGAGTVERLGSGTATIDSKRKTTFFGVGPRIGANGQVGLGGGGFNVFGSLSGAMLYGKYKDKRDFSVFATDRDTPVPNTTSTSFSVKDKSKNKWVPNVEGEVGLGYNFNAGPGSTVGLQVGYRAEKWWGVSSDAAILSFDSSHSSDQMFHGPFVRLVATFGAAAPMPMASAPPPATPPMMVKNFIVFFDFDKSNITAEAQKTINDAVAAAKAGGSSRVTLTGHTDRSGSEQYNMALSLRRAEAVKANMIRQGVPASAIVVIGKGESAPLVPTADGVREPQNRRVEIVI